MISRHYCRNCERPIAEREKLYDQGPHMPAHLTINACQCDHADQIVETYVSEKHTRMTHYDASAYCETAWSYAIPISWVAQGFWLEIGSNLANDNQLAANHFAGKVVTL